MFRTFLIAGLMAITPALASDLDGVWMRGDANARVRIAPCGSQICATNIWVGDTSKGEAVGDRLVMTLTKKSETSYAGQAYDEKRKLNLSMDIKVAPNRLSSSGCVLGGVICRSMTWSR